MSPLPARRAEIAASTPITRAATAWWIPSRITGTSLPDQQLGSSPLNSSAAVLFKNDGTHYYAELRASDTRFLAAADSLPLRPGTGNFSVVAVVTPRVNLTGVKIIVSKRDGSFAGWNIYTDGAVLKASLDDDVGSPVTVVGPTLTLGVRYVVALVRSGTQARLVVDGVAGTPVTAPVNSLDNTKNFTINRNAVLAPYSDIDFFGVAWFKGRALADAQTATVGSELLTADRTLVSPSFTSPLITASDVGTARLFWTRPYANPGTGGAYVWVGSTAHGTAANSMYRGFSGGLNTPPSTWTVFAPPGSTVQNESPHLIHDPAEARPLRLYYHPNSSVSGGTQSTKLAAYATDWSDPSDVGEVMPYSGNAGLTLGHTGYAYVERRSATDWHAWSLTNVAGPDCGYWTSADGEFWTCVNPAVDGSSMVPGAREYNQNTINRFTIGATTYAVLIERPTGVGSGDAPRPGNKVAICTMVDEVTFGSPTIIWEPLVAGLADDLRGIRAVQDPSTPSLIHLYPQIGHTTVYYATHTVT